MSEDLYMHFNGSQVSIFLCYPRTKHRKCIANHLISYNAWICPDLTSFVTFQGGRHHLSLSFLQLMWLQFRMLWMTLKSSEPVRAILVLARFRRNKNWVVSLVWSCRVKKDLPGWKEAGDRAANTPISTISAPQSDTSQTAASLPSAPTTSLSLKARFPFLFFFCCCWSQPALSPPWTLARTH